MPEPQSQIILTTQAAYICQMHNLTIYNNDQRSAIT